MAHEVASASATAWPDLARVGHITDRPATADDVKTGNATFVILNNDWHPLTKPVHVTIPQYAMFIDRDTGQKVPVVVIQMEDRAGEKIVGFRLVGERGFGACLLSELQLLGTKRPS